MTFTDEQKLFLKTLSASGDGRILIEIFEGLITQTKEEVLAEKISPKEGRSLIDKFETIQQVMGLLKDKAPRGDINPGM